MAKIVGIDLGTTTSAISYLKNGKPEIIANLEGKRITDSVVAKDRFGNIVVGEVAKRMRGKDIDKVEEVKRYMGTDRKFTLGNQEYTPEEISAEILKKLKYDAEEFLGEEIEEAVITVPAMFTNFQKTATIKAGELAGLKVERIISEPTAAAMAYGIENMEAEQNILVYDFGGGTFDVSILELDEGILDVIATSGDNLLGGKDIDKLLSKYVLDKIGKTNEANVETIKLEAEDTKKTLSSAFSAELIVPALKIDFEITREEFEKIIQPIVNKSLEHVEIALKEADLTVEDIDVVLLVGGTTRIPLIKKSLKDMFGNKVKTFADPQEAVALGAGVQAGIKSNEISSEDGLIVTDICNYSLGVDCIDEYQGELMPGVYSVIIPKHSKLPSSKSEIYYTVVDNQTVVDVGVYQGEGKLVVENTLLKEFAVEGIPENMAGAEQIKITFSYNLNDILEVETEIVSTGYKKKVSVEMNESKASNKKINYKDSVYYSDYKMIIDMAEDKLDKVSGDNKTKIMSLLNDMKASLVAEDKVKLEKFDSALTNLLFEV